MKKLLLIALLIMGCVYADVDSTVTKNAETLPEYKYRFLIGTSSVWPNKNITGVDKPINFMFNFRIDKPFGVGLEYLKFEENDEDYYKTWKRIIPSLSYDIKTDSDRFILELIMGAELTKLEWEREDWDADGSLSEWSGIFGCRVYYKIKNNFYIGMLGMLRESWWYTMRSDGKTEISWNELKIRPDFGIYYMFK